MKILFLLGLLFSVGCAHQGYRPVTGNVSCLKKYDSKLNRNIYTIVDEMPEFPGGLGAMKSYVIRNMSFDDKNIQGTLRFEIVIDTDGTVVDEKIPGKELADYSSSDKELLRVLSLMPKWKSGACKNQKVAVRMPMKIYINWSS